MSVETLVNALDGLQNDADRRQEYNVWLQEFQRSAKAWEVAYEILESDSYPRPLKIFCAQTLRNKVAFDIHQVPRDSRLHLKDQILLLLERNAALLNVVGVQLCIALAAFAMQVNEWDQPIEELMARFDSAEMVPLLFEFLKVLPEEFNSTRLGMVDPSLRLARSTSLVQNTAPLVLNFMMSRADIMSQQGSTQSLFFETLKPWLNEIDLPQIIASPLVQWILSAIDNEEARSAAVDCLITVLDETTEVQEPVVQEAIQVLFPKIVALAPQYAPLYGDDADLHRDLTRLFSETAKDWHMLIAKDPDNFMPLLQAVAQCVVAPQIELEAVEFTFDFFDKLRTVLGDPLPGSTASPTAISCDPFRPIFIQLFEAFTRLLEFPASFNGNLEEEELFRDFRYDIGDMLKICSSIAGYSQTLKWCYDQISQIVSIGESRQIKPQSLEALLFSIRAIARTVPFEESEWLPKIYDLLGQLPHSQTELVQHSALMLLGRYSQWSALHPQYLETELQYVTSSVWSHFYEVRRAAAHAFLYLCTDASQEMIPFLPQLLQFYGTLSGRVELEAMCKYSDGLGAIICHLQGAELGQAITVVFTPVAERASALLVENTKQATTATTKNEKSLAEQAQQVGFDIQGLGSMIAMISVPEIGEGTKQGDGSEFHPLVQAVKTHHELFTTIMMQLNAQTEILDSIARYYIRIIFNIGAALPNEIPALLKAIRVAAQANPVQPVLFELGSAIIQCYNARQEAPAPLVTQVWEFSSQMCEALLSAHTLELLKTEGGIVERLTPISSMIYHGFHMLCDLTIYYPTEFFNQIFEPAVLLSIQIFNLSWDTEALVAVSHFYDDIESFVPQFGNSDQQATNAERAKISEMIEKHGYLLVHSLFYLFLLKPDNYFETMAEKLIDFAFRLAPVTSVSWLQQLLLTLPPGTVSDEEKIVFAQRIFQLVSAGNRGIGQEMNEFVKAYAARNISPR